eukprot:3283545-Rhodomonas_salina.1
MSGVSSRFLLGRSRLWRSGTPGQLNPIKMDVRHCTTCTRKTCTPLSVYSSLPIACPPTSHANRGLS